MYWMNKRILYTIIDGDITGGNIIALRTIEEALRIGLEVVVNSPTEGRLTDILRKKGVQVYNVDTRRSFRFDSAIKLATIIKKERINLVHTHVPLGGTILSRLAGGLTGVAVINHIHIWESLNANPVVRRYQFILNWVTSRLFCAKVIAVSESVKKVIIKQGVAEDKIIVVHNGIDLNDYSCNRGSPRIREEFGLKENQPVVGEISRLCDAKGQPTLIKSVPKVIKEIPDAIFMIVGEDLERKGEYRKRLEDLANDLGVNKRIIFTGYRSDIMELLDTFSVFVLPTLVEGISLVILEAMLAKKAVITTPVGGNPELVVDGKTATFVLQENPDKLAEAIIYHLEHPEISKRMGQEGYERVNQFFSLTQMLDKIMDIYKVFLER